MTNSRENLQLTLNHQQPDRMVVDFGASPVTGIHVLLVEQLRERFESTGAIVEINETATGATGVVRWPDDREARVLVTSPETEPRHLIFIFYPDPGGAEVVRSPA